ncbi:MAG: c-type cytochrome [Alteromonas sp.]|nr:c-type cytochrome [Alteromonas sp.]
MKYYFGKVLLLISLGSSPVYSSAPPKEALCRACHGVDGAAPIANNYPKLNGQNKDYLVSALKAYRGGQRQGALAAAMSAQAKGLSDAEIDALADFYSKK